MLREVSVTFETEGEAKDAINWSREIDVSSGGVVVTVVDVVGVAVVPTGFSGTSCLDFFVTVGVGVVEVVVEGGASNTLSNEL